MNRIKKGASRDALFRVLGESADKLIIAALPGSICLFVLYPIVKIFSRSVLPGFWAQVPNRFCWM